LYVEDLKQGANNDIGPKDIFEMGSNKKGSTLMMLPLCWFIALMLSIQPDL
jgi:hypothetical protein